MAVQRAAISAEDKKKLSSRKLKRLRKYIKWEPDQTQLQEAYLLLNGKAPYSVPPPKCLSLKDPRVKDGRKWMGPQSVCDKFYSSQLD